LGEVAAKIAMRPPVQRGRPELAVLAPMVWQPAFRLSAPVRLEVAQQVGARNRVIVTPRVRVKQHVEVLRHGDLSDQTDPVPGPQTIETVDDDLLDGVSPEETQAMKQEMIQERT
jgi:hypothetical protein